MKRRFSAFALALVAAAPFAPVAVAPLAAQSRDTQELGRVSAYIRAVNSLTADFAQTDRNGQTVTGKLSLKQPGKIRFQYQKDVPLLIVSDGRALTMIDYEVRQVQQWPIRNSPLGALLDPSRDFTKFGRVVQSGDPGILTIEARDPKRPEFGTITLVFNRKPTAPAGLELYGWVATDAQNNRTAVRLSNHSYGASLPDSTFRWKDPRARTRPNG